MLYPVALAVLAHDILRLGHDGADLPGVTCGTTLPANDAVYLRRLVPAVDPLRPSTKPVARRRDRVPPSAPILYEEYDPYGSRTGSDVPSIQAD